MELVSQRVAVIAVLAALGGALWWLRRKGLAHFAPAGGQRKAGRRLELMERLTLTPQHSLHLVRIADKSVLIALSPSGCTVLDSPVSPQVAEAQVNGRPEAIR